MGTSDEETVEQIKENPYLQYFLGLPAYQEKAPLDPSLMTHFRKRLGKDVVSRVNRWITMEAEAENAQKQGVG